MALSSSEPGISDTLPTTAPPLVVIHIMVARRAAPALIDAAAPAFS